MSVQVKKDQFEILNPTTKEVIDVVPIATEEEVDQALSNAVKAKGIWAATPVWKRAQVLQKFADLVEENMKNLSVLLSSEVGKPIIQAKGELTGVVRIFRAYAEKARYLFGQNIPLDHQEGIENDVYITRREPLGVIVGIIPFNYPADIFSHKVAPALATGNAIIIKPPEDAPLTILKLEKYLYEAGLSENALQVLPGEGSIVGQKLVSSPLVNGVSLTGSTEAGILVASSAVKQLARVQLELGGNDPLIVFEDADIDLAVEETVQGRTAMNGQTCIANKRMIIHESKIEKYTEKLVERVKELKIGNPSEESTDIGPLINEEALKRVHKQVQLTVKQGAKVLLGGEIIENTWYPPTVLSNVQPDFDIAQDMEVFGPVFPLISFETEEEALEIANNSCYGLNASVFTKDIDRAMRLGYGIESGIVAINGTGTYRPDISYFGGYKMSGYGGNEGLIGSLEAMTQVKSVAFRNTLNSYDS